MPAAVRVEGDEPFTMLPQPDDVCRSHAGWCGEEGHGDCGSGMSGRAAKLATKHLGLLCWGS